MHDYELESALRRSGEAWASARRAEREAARHALDLARANATSFSEVHLSRLIGCDRMTIRRALGK